MALPAAISIAPLVRIDQLLRGEDRTHRPHRIRHILLVLLVFGATYGAVMGAYAVVTPGHLSQMLYSAIKVPLLLMLTFLLSVPSFYVLNALLGLGSDFFAAIAAVIGAQAVLTIVLTSLGPFVALVYISGCNYDDAILFNGLMFAIASAAGQFALRRSYRPLIARNPRHRWTLRAWLLIYIFVGIQMGWTLRPFIGNPYMPSRFFRDEPMSNAYVAVAEKIRDSLRH